MADDRKRSEMLCVKVTEQVAIDLLRVATHDERGISDYLYRMIRHHLYGTVTRFEQSEQTTT